MISWHDLGCHLGCYGRRDIRTPALDRLAAEGVRLNAFFATNPICSPARASLLSGLTPHRHGLQGLVHDHWRLKPDVRLAEEWFQEAGYRTALVGYQHERPKNEPCRADEVWTESSRAADVVPQVCQRLETFAREGNPFFLRTGFFEVHRPLMAESDEGWEDVAPLPYLKDTEEHRRQLARYHKLIERADAGVGTLLKCLEETGLAANTLVVFVTDHGVPFPGAKLTLYDAGIRVAGILRAPGILPQGTEVNEQVSSVDLLPTLLDLCGIPSDVSTLDGSSLAPLLRGETHAGREAIFAERAMPALMRAIRDGRYKYIVNFETLPPSRLIGAEELTTPISMSLTDSLRRNTPAEELYDISADPCEQKNLTADPEHAGVKAKLRSRLQEWMRQTEDPLLKKDVLSPAFERAWALISAPAESGISSGK